MQYFSLALGEPYEGRYEEEEEKNSDFRLIYGESAFAQKDALRLLAAHISSPADQTRQLAKLLAILSSAGSASKLRCIRCVSLKK